MKEKIKILLKRIRLYHPLQSTYRKGITYITGLIYKAKYRRYRGSGYECNFCGAVYSKFVPEYPGAEIRNAIERNRVIAGYGENVYCPKCLSKNRERLVKAVVDHLIRPTPKRVLHFSPEKNLNHYLNSIATVTSIDIEPGFYKEIDPNIQYGDATRLSIADNSYDMLVANHILEHIPNDLQAMAEMYRVLNHDGVAILQAPWSQTLPVTIEEPSISDPARQEILFGQRDHVRIYTLADYTDRLRNAGFNVTVIMPIELEPFKKYAIQEDEPVVLGYK